MLIFLENTGVIHDRVTTYRWSLVVLLSGGSEGMGLVTRGEYSEDLERSDGMWRIQRRRLQLDLPSWGSDSRSEGEPEQHPVRCHIVTPAIESHQHGANYGESMKVRSAVAAATIAGMALVLSACASSSTSTPTESAASDLGVAAADVAE